MLRFKSFLTEAAKKPAKKAATAKKPKASWTETLVKKVDTIAKKTVAAKKATIKKPVPPKQPPSKWATPKAPGTTVMVFAGMDPVTVGHEKIIRQAQKHAQTLGAKLKVITSHSDDKNKMKHLQRAFPDIKIHVAPKDKKSIVHHVKAAYDDGTKDLVVMAGGDRVKQYQTFLQNYNGTPAAGYKFRSIKVVDAGKKAAGLVSGLEQRDNAGAGDFHRFRAGLPTTIAQNFVHSREMFKDTARSAKKAARAKKK